MLQPRRQPPPERSGARVGAKIGASTHGATDLTTMVGPSAHGLTGSGLAMMKTVPPEPPGARKTCARKVCGTLLTNHLKGNCHVSNGRPDTAPLAKGVVLHMPHNRNVAGQLQLGALLAKGAVSHMPQASSKEKLPPTSAWLLPCPSHHPHHLPLHLPGDPRSDISSRPSCMCQAGNFCGQMVSATGGNSMPRVRDPNAFMETNAHTYMNGLSRPGKRHASTPEKE